MRIIECSIIYHYMNVITLIFCYFLRNYMTNRFVLRVFGDSNKTISFESLNNNESSCK